MEVRRRRVRLQPSLLLRWGMCGGRAETARPEPSVRRPEAAGPRPVERGQGWESPQASTFPGGSKRRHATQGQRRRVYIRGRRRGGIVVRWRNVRMTEVQRTAAVQTVPPTWPPATGRRVFVNLFGSAHYHTKSQDLLQRHWRWR